MQTVSLNNFYRRRDMTPITNPAVREAAAAMQAALKTGSEKEINQAFELFNESVIEAVKEEASMGNDAILASRGQRVLTSQEKKFYQAWIDNAKSTTPQQAFTDILDGGIPETIIQDVYRNLTNEHPLLDMITFTNVNYLTKWILNDHTKQTAAWGTITSEIKQQISSGFKIIEIVQCKLSCFAVLPKDLLDLPNGPTFLDQYIRTILTEAIAVSLEAAIVSGDGLNKPIGLNRNIKKGVSVNTSTGYPKKTAIKVTNFLPEQYGKLVSKLVKTEAGTYRQLKEDSLALICNPVDYYEKIMPATTILTAAGTYAGDIFPVKTRPIQSAELTEGEAILCIPSEYFAAIASSKEGNVVYDDSVQFLEDCRVYMVKMFANGRAWDDTVAILLDISKLEAAYITVINKAETVSA